MPELLNHSDIDLVIEIGAELPKAPEAMQRWPYLVRAYHGPDAKQLRVFSALPLSELSLTDPALIPGTLTVLVDLHGIPLPLSVVSYPQPTSAQAARERWLTTRRVATAARQAPNGYLLIGEFNTTIYASTYSHLANGGELNDLLEGRGVFRRVINLTGQPQVDLFYRGPFKLELLDSEVAELPFCQSANNSCLKVLFRLSDAARPVASAGWLNSTKSP